MRDEHPVRTSKEIKTSDLAMKEAIEDQFGGIGGLSRATSDDVTWFVLFAAAYHGGVPASGVLGIDPAFIELFLAAICLLR